MLCPNCGDVEDGSWLYANASTSSSPDFSINDREYSSFPDFSIDDWEWEDLYDYLFADDLSTFNGMTGDSSFEQVESSPTPTNVQYQSGGRHLPSLSANRNLLNGVEHILDPSTMRNTRVDSDAILRSGPSALPFLYGDSSFPGGGSLIVSSLNHPGSITYPHERIQVSHVGHPPQGNPTSLLPTIMPGASRFSGPIGMPVSTPAPPQEISNIFPYPGSQNLHLENRNRLSRFPVMPFDRESGWDPERQWYGGADPSQRSGNFWPEWP
ncbi:uncharacterized protein LOC141697767 isoform X3 [Apium graveolens]|uniref:uncharacterized protein LOC141697767 isoform X3 n=1 Tax=Apium graveolens TaxID=4045 RepID=UPI003D7BBC18